MIHRVTEIKYHKGFLGYSCFPRFCDFVLLINDLVFVQYTFYRELSYKNKHCIILREQKQS